MVMTRPAVSGWRVAHEAAGRRLSPRHSAFLPPRTEAGATRTGPVRPSSRCSRLLLVALSIAIVGCATTEIDPSGGRGQTFEERCAQPGVVKCFTFDSQEQTDPFIFPPHGMTRKRAEVVTDVKASGAGSLRFEIPSNSSSDTSGGFW
jgi:hypothetical protein